MNKELRIYKKQLKELLEGFGGQQFSYKHL